jgi:hypothetical protein
MGAYNIVNSAALQAGQPEDISVVLSNLQAIQTVLNGGIDNSNISGAAAILASKLAGYPTDATKFLSGAGTWLAAGYTAIPKVTVSSFAAGPPGSPSDGDIWIGTSVDGTTKRWGFQYNAASGSANKWEFIGGPPVVRAASANMTYTGTGAYQAYNGFAGYAIQRAGDYIMAGGCVGTDPALGGSHTLQCAGGIGTAIVGTSVASLFTSTAGVNDSSQISFATGEFAAAAANVINLIVQCGVNNVVFSQGFYQLIPARVS